MIITLVTGDSRTGKTYVAQCIAKEQNTEVLELLNKDTLENEKFKLKGKDKVVIVDNINYTSFKELPKEIIQREFPNAKIYHIHCFK